MTFRIVLFDMREFRSVVECRNVPVQIPKPFVNRWISATNITNIAFEMLHVYRLLMRKEAISQSKIPSSIYCNLRQIG